MAETHAANFLENLPAYALGALDAGEAAELEVHLRSCDECRTELARFQAVRDNLLTALPPRNPPPGLRRRLVARLPGARKSTGPRLRLTWSFGQFAVAAMLMLLLGFNLLSIVQIRSLQRQQADLTHHLEANQAAVAMLAYPSVQTFPVNGEGIAGSLLIDKDLNTAVLVAWNLPRLPADQTYRIWLVDSTGEPVGGGAFLPDRNQPFTSVTIASQRPLGDFHRIEVTVEKQGGSPAPAGPVVLYVNF